MGQNGSGKTSILWAIILFCRGYNCLVSHKEITLDNPEDLSDLLNYKALSTMSSFKHFLPRGTSNDDQPTEISALLNNSRYTCKFSINGRIVITPTPNEKTTEKI